MRAKTTSAKRIGILGPKTVAKVLTFAFLSSSKSTTAKIAWAAEKVKEKKMKAVFRKPIPPKREYPIAKGPKPKRQLKRESRTGIDFILNGGEEYRYIATRQKRVVPI